MPQLFYLLDSEIVFTMGTFGFISVPLSIFLPDLGTSISLFKLPMGGWFWSLCTGTVTSLRWNMVGWIVRSVWFAVSVLSVSTILTNTLISVFGNNIWAGCSMPAIQFLVIFLPSGVVICLNTAIILSIQVRKYFVVPSLIVFLAFSMVLLASTVLLVICSIVLLAFGSIVLLAIILLFSSFFLKGIWKSSWQYYSLPFFFFYWVILSLLIVMFETLLKFSVLYSGYAARISDSLWQLST